MLITLTCQTPNAADLGYLFAKHPGSVFELPFSAGTVWAFYPELSDDRLAIALVTAPDATLAMVPDTDFITARDGQGGVAEALAAPLARPHPASNTLNSSAALAPTLASIGRARRRIAITPSTPTDPDPPQAGVARWLFRHTTAFSLRKDTPHTKTAL